MEIGAGRKLYLVETTGSGVARSVAESGVVSRLGRVGVGSRAAGNGGVRIKIGAESMKRRQVDAGVVFYLGVV